MSRVFRNVVRTVMCPSCGFKQDFMNAPSLFSVECRCGVLYRAREGKPAMLINSVDKLGDNNCSKPADEGTRKPTRRRWQEFRG